MNQQPMPKSFRKWAMPGQNDGSQTKRQRAFSINDRKKHEDRLNRAAPMHSNSVYSYRPGTINSRRTKTKSRKGYPPALPLTLNNLSVSLKTRDGRTYQRRPSGQLVRISG